MVTTFGSEITSAYTNGQTVGEIYAYGVKVWPTTQPSDFYVKWWPKDLSGSFIMGDEARWLEDYSGLYTGPFIKVFTPDPMYCIDRFAFESTGVIAVDTNLEFLSVGAFANCESLYYFTAKSGCMRISSKVFYNCTSLYSVELLSASIVGSWAFEGCTNLREVELPNCSVIWEWCFYHCTELKTITLPKCRVLDDCAFQECYKLSYVELPICSRINASVFLDCSKLSTLVLGYSGVCSGLGLANSPLGLGRGSIYVPLEWVSEYKTSYPGTANLFQPIPHN